MTPSSPTMPSRLNSSAPGCSISPSPEKPGPGGNLGNEPPSTSKPVYAVDNHGCGQCSHPGCGFGKTPVHVWSRSGAPICGYQLLTSASWEYATDLEAFRIV